MATRYQPSPSPSNGSLPGPRGFACSSGPCTLLALTPRALEGLKVLDLSRILAGPTATQMLGDLGADVVKVERPGKGDDTRGWGPPFLPMKKDHAPMAGYFVAANRSKRSIAIDVSSEAGAELVRRLAEQADVLVENLKPGDLDARGLGYEALKERCPRLVYCSISGFGRTGPRKSEPGYDFLAQAAGGLMSITGEPEGTPQKLGVGIADLYTGMHATIGILAALRHRDRTGEGQSIDVSLFDSQLAMLTNVAVDHFLTGSVPPRLGNAHAHIVPYGVFEVSDGHLVIAVGNDAQFARFAELLGAPVLALDPRFQTNRGRVANRRALTSLIEPILLEQAMEPLLEALRAARIPTSRVADVGEALSDPVAEARGMRQAIPMEGAVDGFAPVLGNPVRLSATPPSASHPPPELDEHRHAILADWLALDEAACRELDARGAFGRHA